MKLIHHGPVKQTCSRGYGGVGIVISAESVIDWIEAGRSVNRWGVGGTMWCMLLKTNIIKSNNQNTTKLHISSAYYPDLWGKSVEYFQ
jgi:hypothetical protein